MRILLMKKKTTLVHDGCCSSLSAMCEPRQKGSEKGYFKGSSYLNFSGLTNTFLDCSNKKQSMHHNSQIKIYKICF